MRQAMSCQEYMLRISWWKARGLTLLRRRVEIASVVALIKSNRLDANVAGSCTIFLWFGKDCHLWGEDFGDSTYGCGDDVKTT